MKLELVVSILTGPEEPVQRDNATMPLATVTVSILTGPEEPVQRCLGSAV